MLDRAQEEPFCPVHPALLSPQQQRPARSWIYGNQSLLYRFVAPMKPQTGPDENRKGEQRGGVSAEAGNHNRKRQWFTARVRDQQKPS